MNFPVGSVIAKGSLPVFFSDLAQQLADKRFSGYIIQTVKGTLIEEGVLFFRDGELFACMVECLGAKKSLKGNSALSYFFNETKGSGFFHCVELTRSQVDLVTAFDESLMFGSKIALKDVPKLIPSSFESKFTIEENNEFSLDAYGLGELKQK